MTVLAVPSTIIAAVAHPAEPTTPAAYQAWHRWTAAPADPRSSRGQPAAAGAGGPATGGQGPSRRADRPAHQADSANLRLPATAGSRDQKRTVDTWPLRGSDPITVDGYRLLARLGSGGMAEVYLAGAPTGDLVAVKVLRDSIATQACQREYRLASTVDDDCTAPALGYGMSAAGAYLVTGYLPGYRCAATLVGRPTPAEPLWKFGSALARTLAAVHARGVVHCDVKPSNLLIRGDDVRLIDFGIARYVGERYGGGVVQCSRGWAAPEQLWTVPATPAVDVFAWGCLLAQLATGVHPFASQSEQEWILRVQSAQPDLFGLPPGLDDVIRATLARDPRNRPTAGELVTICRTRDDGHPQTLPRPRLETAATPRPRNTDIQVLAPTVWLAPLGRRR